MDSTQVSSSFFQNEWTIYLVSILVLVVLYFVQKFAYLIDRKLNQVRKSESNWEGKPWPLIAGILLGVFTMLYNVFSPSDMQLNPASWHWPEWTLIVSFFVISGFLLFESISHFGIQIGMLRFLFLFALTVGFFYAGLLAGLLIVVVLVVIIIIYFLMKWRKIMVIK